MLLYTMKIPKKNFMTSFLTICKLFDQVSMDIFVQIQCFSSTLICNKEFIQLSMFSLKINYHRAVEKDIQKTVLTPEQHIPVLAALFLFTPSLTFSIPSFSIQSCSRHCHISVHHDITFQQSRGRLPCVERTSPARCTCVSCASTRGVSNAYVRRAWAVRVPRGPRACLSRVPRGPARRVEEDVRCAGLHFARGYLRHYVVVVFVPSANVTTKDGINHRLWWLSWWGMRL